MAMANGAVLPAMVIVFGDMTNSFVDNSILGNLPPNLTFPGGEYKNYLYMSIYFDLQYVQFKAIFFSIFADLKAINT